MNRGEIPSCCPRCWKPKRPDYFSCSPCWKELPRDIRQGIWRAFDEHGPMSREWSEAAKRAFAFWGMAAPRWLSAAMEAL